MGAESHAGAERTLLGVRAPRVGPRALGTSRRGACRSGRTATAQAGFLLRLRAQAALLCQRSRPVGALHPGSTQSQHTGVKQSSAAMAAAPSTERAIKGRLWVNATHFGLCVSNANALSISYCSAAALPFEWRATGTRHAATHPAHLHHR